MRIALVQTHPSDHRNTLQVSYEKACQQQARILLVSARIDPAHDKAWTLFQQMTHNQTCALVMSIQSGHQRQICVFEQGKMVFQVVETEFNRPSFWFCDGEPILLSASWQSLLVLGPQDLKGASCILLSEAVLYERGLLQQQRQGFQRMIQSVKRPLVYAQAAGASDRWLWLGGSGVMDAQGVLQGSLPTFEEVEAIGEVKALEVTGYQMHPEEASAILVKGLVCGIRSYFEKAGFQKAYLGLSGGIDSAVVAVLAKMALGPQHVVGVAMPSEVSSLQSLRDAEQLAERLGISFQVSPIKFLYSTIVREWLGLEQTIDSLVLENLQARLRGLTLMTLASQAKALVLSTGNKSELAMGYCTLYGDLIGALSPLGDLLKTQVYELARFLNETQGHPIPQSILLKPPSAELRPHQQDSDTLPPYPILDAFLSDYLEQGLTETECMNKHQDAFRGQVMSMNQVLHQMASQAFKRRQAPEVLQVSRQARSL